MCSTARHRRAAVRERPFQTCMQFVRGRTLHRVSLNIKGREFSDFLPHRHPSQSKEPAQRITQDSSILILSLFHTTQTNLECKNVLGQLPFQFTLRIDVPQNQRHEAIQFLKQQTKCLIQQTEPWRLASSVTTTHALISSQRFTV